ncbi:MAG: alpha/beta fold hydrolase [Cyanobacteria bacterium P01_F01_bin.4]
MQYWFFEQNLPHPHHFNMSYLLEVTSDFKPAILQPVLRYLLCQHDALRLRFNLSETGWQQLNAAEDDTDLIEVIDLSGIPMAQQAPILAAKATELQASLNLGEGPLLQAAYFNLGEDQPGRLLLLVHHLAIDGVSWRIFLEDLCTAYQQIEQKQALALSSKTSSFQDWAERLNAYASSPALADELTYWLDQQYPEISLPVDDLSSHDLSGATINTKASRATVSVSLSREQTHRLLQEIPAVYNTQINDVLLTAFAQSLSQWTGEGVLVDLEGHGREDLFEGLDLSRTVGWFTTVFPVWLDLGNHSQPGDALKVIKEHLRRIPNRGIGYGVLRYLHPDPATRLKLQGISKADISFNYLGQLDRMLSEYPILGLAPESTGPDHSPLGQRRYLLEVNGWVSEGQLQMNWTYSQNIHRQGTIEALAQTFLDALVGLITHCQSAKAGGYTPSDFPAVTLSQPALDQVLTELSQTHSERNIEAIYPLSRSQQGMLLETLSRPASGIHVEQSVWHLQGDLNVTAFEQSWQQVVERHAILRTGFVWGPQNAPLQVSLKQVDVTLSQAKGGQTRPEDPTAQLDPFLQADRLRGFDFASPPLMRWTLLQTGEQTYQFVWSFHHILLDGWCIPLIKQEVLTCYKALSEGHTISLPPSRPYQDYILWRQQQEVSSAKVFWQQMLAGFVKPTPMGTLLSASHASNQSRQYGQQQDSLSPQITAGLQALAKRHRLTMNTLVQGVWALLLSHYSGDLDVVFGTTVSGRPAALAGVESIIGPFINTLPARVKVSPESSLWSWLQEIQAQQAETHAYDYCSAGEIQGWSDMPGAFALFESILVFENYPSDALDLELNTRFDLNQTHKGAETSYALTLIVLPGSDVTFKGIYHCDRFNHLDVTQLLKDLVTLLADIVATPTLSLAGLLDKLPAGERLNFIAPLQRSSTGEGLVASRTEPERQLTQIWERCLGIQPIGVKDNFFDLGGHSLLAVQLFAEIEQAFDQNLPLVTLFQSPTIEAMASILHQSEWVAPWSSLVLIKSGGAKPPLFCIHAVGPSILNYRNLTPYLDPEQPVYGLQAQGQDGKQAPLTRIEDMAAHYIQEIRTVQPEGPYFILGHSFGGLVAYEMARQLHGQNAQVGLVALLDTISPKLSAGELSFGDRLSLHRLNLSRLRPTQQLSYLRERVRWAVERFDQKLYNFTHGRVGRPSSAELPEKYQRIEAADHQAASNYVPQAYPGKVTLFRAITRPTKVPYEPNLGWAELANGGLDIQEVFGDHLSLILEPHVQPVSERLRDCIETALIEKAVIEDDASPMETPSPEFTLTSPGQTG